jgi:hypothetical protein
MYAPGLTVVKKVLERLDTAALDVCKRIVSDDKRDNVVGENPCVSIRAVLLVSTGGTVHSQIHLTYSQVLGLTIA